MKLERNMYIRTRAGKIHKVKKITEHDVIIIEKDKSVLYMGIKLEGEKKTSHNLMDLIEKNDIVNGNVIEGLRVSNGQKQVVINEGMDSLYLADIKTILTKEQYEKYAYKVVD